MLLISKTQHYHPVGQWSKGVNEKRARIPWIASETQASSTMPGTQCLWIKLPRTLWGDFTVFLTCPHSLPTHLVCVSVCVCRHICVCVGAQECACMRVWRPKVYLGNRPSLFFYLIHWGRVSQGNPDLTNTANLTRQLDLRILLSPPFQDAITGGFWGLESWSLYLRCKHFLNIESSLQPWTP